MSLFLSVGKFNNASWMTFVHFPDTMDFLAMTILFTVVSIGKSSPSMGPRVDTNLGTIVGSLIPFSPRHLSRGGSVKAFMGIPFARPPVAERRFRLPEPVEPWDEYLDATRVPPSCPQIVPRFYEHFLTNSGFSEDCLYLNVFVPENLKPNATVMVFIHGGANIRGSGSDFPLNPIPLAWIGNVIVVTINYRLGIFGFLTTGDSSIPQNIGLFDQRLALQWVSQNIKVFGGDPSQIALFGQGSGAANAGFHMLTSESRKFFRRVILQSGSPLIRFAAFPSEDQIAQRAMTISSLSGCNMTDTQDCDYVADCLRNKTVEELLSLQATANSVYPGTNIWKSSFDGIFFENDIPDLLASGTYNETDLLIGTTEDDGTFVTYVRTGTPVDQPFVDKGLFNRLTIGSENVLVSALLEAIYSSGIDQSGNYEEAASDALGHATFSCNITSFARQVSTAGSNVFMYVLTQQPSRSVFNASWLHAAHVEDLQFVFGVPFFGNPLYVPTYEELKVSYYVIQMWTNFAKSGNPNFPVDLPGDIPKWPQFYSNSEEYKELNIEFLNKRNRNGPFCNFWNNLLDQIIYLQNAVDRDIYAGNT